MICVTLLLGCSQEEGGIPAPPGSGTDAKPGIIHLDKFGSDVLVYHNPEFEVFAAFYPTSTSGEQLEMSYLPASFPDILVDETGSIWDIFGKCTRGQNLGKSLQRPAQMVGFWFAVSSTFAEVTLFTDTEVRSEIIVPGNEEWAVDPSFVFVAAPRDGITAIDEPTFTYLSKPVDFELAFMNDEDRVAVIPDGNDLFVIPIPVMNWHEVVNIHNRPELGTYTYCPLTGTSVHLNRQLELGRFGVSGFLYNNNLIMFDRNMETLWSQMSSSGIRGPQLDHRLEQLFVIEMNWKSIKTIAPSMYVLDPGDFYGRPYDIHPYGDYDNNETVTFSLTYEDQRLPSKERVLAIHLENGTVAVRAADFLP
jgi:hypothetical protein